MRISGICRTHGYYKGERCPRCNEVPSDDSKWTTNLFLIGEAAKRSDVEFGTTTMGDSIDHFSQKKSDKWQEVAAEAMRA